MDFNSIFFYKVKKKIQEAIFVTNLVEIQQCHFTKEENNGLKNKNRFFVVVKGSTLLLKWNIENCWKKIGFRFRVCVFRIRQYSFSFLFLRKCNIFISNEFLGFFFGYLNKYSFWILWHWKHFANLLTFSNSIILIKNENAVGESF